MKETIEKQPILQILLQYRKAIKIMTNELTEEDKKIFYNEDNLIAIIELLKKLNANFNNIYSVYFHVIMKGLYTEICNKYKTIQDSENLCNQWLIKINNEEIIANYSSKGYKITLDPDNKHNCRQEYYISDLVNDTKREKIAEHFVSILNKLN